MRKLVFLAVGVLLLGRIERAEAAASEEQKCVAAKLAAAGKYAACRAGADKKAELNETTADYTKCDAKQLTAWTKIEEKYGERCATSGDQAEVQTEIRTSTQCLVDSLSPAGLPPAIQVECVPCPADGLVIDGTCWILGAAGDSCTAACAQQDMAYDEKTNSYAATTATGGVGHCFYILDQFGYPTSQTTGTYLNGPLGYGVGCAVALRAYFTGPATAQGSFNQFQRLCACQ